MSLLNIGRGPACYNYYVLRGILDEQVIKEARAVADALPHQEGKYSKSGANKMYAYLDQIPSLVALLPQIFDDLHIVGSNYFISEPTDPKEAALGEWHSGHSLYFGVKGTAYTMWIPLQDLNEETGGRLKLYNGRYISQIDDLLDCQVRNVGNSISNEHCILKFLNHELEEGKKTPNMSVGDALIFDEMLPHQAEKCNIHREALAVRIVVGDLELDKELIKRVIQRYKSEPGEIGYAAEYLQNLLDYDEYKAPEPGAPKLDAPREPMPVGDSDLKRSLWQRARERLGK